MSTVTELPSLDIAQIRGDFPILNRPLPNGKRLVYLDSGATAQKPRVVLDRLAEVYGTYYSNVHRGQSTLGMKVSEELEISRARLQRLLNAEMPEEIIFSSGTTLALNLVALSWGRQNVGPGDEILVTAMEHHANLVPWQLLAQERGAELKMIPLTDTWELDLGRLDEILTEKTKLVAVTQLSNVTGTINPIAELAEAAHRRDAVIVVDAAQSAAHGAVDVRGLGVDFLALSGHKLYGPSGVGVLYGKREHLESMPPVFGGGNMIAEVFDDYATWAQLPAKFEAGTPPIAEAIGLGAAVEYVERIGFENITAHERALAEYAHERLADVKDLTIYGPPVDRKGGIFSFTIAGASAEDLNFLLDRKGIAIRHGHHCTMPLHRRLGVSATVRASLGVYNNRDDIDALVEGLREARKRLRLE